ncbi:MAG: Heptaprenyl diphosphate synthase component II [Candidatus Carbobacillus altaicus]|uniref:Heptaprenyl diphosphate synthase component II n=1 Tax=Candidatus Carbonibacillus altaicus TaxID=2163959 RepID=A0A2R6Y1P3_9BACL|nr:MAG: Heptaprenyl diphosphate synthase component II [Candidatus Carbobacillus altaicus]
MHILDVYETYQEGLGRVEDTLSKLIARDIPLYADTSRHLLEAGGKRMRPLVVLIAGQFGEVRETFDERLVRLGAIMELIHMATLVHDDVVDESDTRRGRPTVAQAWDEPAAVYTGDYLLSVALRELASFDDILLHKTLARALTEMSRGELEQLQDLFSAQVSMKRYLRRIRRKTALLIEMSARLGARITGAHPAVQKAVSAYAYATGMAFQLTDDILDITGSTEQLGKPAGSDLLQGNVTLPVILDLTCGDPDLRRALYAYLEKGRQMKREGIRADEWKALVADELVFILSRLKVSEAIGYSRRIVHRYVEKAYQALSHLESDEKSEALRSIVHFVENRRF